MCVWPPTTPLAPLEEVNSLKRYQSRGCLHDDGSCAFPSALPVTQQARNTAANLMPASEGIALKSQVIQETPCHPLPSNLTFSVLFYNTYVLIL